MDEIVKFSVVQRV